MKKIISIFIVLMLVAMLCACGNMSLGLGEYTFKKVHVDTHHHSKCFTVKEWHDNERGIEVKTKEAGSMYLSEGTYILISDRCPFCG